ncbi:metalloregulator ArsR/SmtB family transcription factor [Rhodoglobus aureus]|uniref:HTH arsR-type domain-containing protein n=1 Tax=Rhodoglobus aureus TaxID=191497 RepID=A0ABN1VMH8_9MICO
MTRTLFPPETQAFLKALGSETRQSILFEFAAREALTVGEVAENCGIGQSTASEQLAIMHKGGLVTATRTGKRVHYRADPALMRAQMALLDDYLDRCCPPQPSSEAASQIEPNGTLSQNSVGSD